MADISIYSDFNCPFCFAYAERLAQHGLSQNLRWRYIEHAPEIITQANTQEQLNLMDTEYQLVLQRAPDIQISKPSFCINSHLATIAIISYEKQYPEYAEKYRVAIYRAYWLGGEDISNPKVLEKLQLSLPVQAPLVHPEAEQVLALNQSRWLRKEVERRIPAIESDRGQLLGLQNIYNVENFISGDSLRNDNSHLSCHYQSSQKIALVGLKQHHQEFSRFYDKGKCVFCEDMNELFEQLDGVVLQAVVFFDHCEGDKAWANLRLLRDNSTLNRYLPAIAVVDSCCEKSLSQAYLMGATDVINSNQLQSFVLPQIKSRISQYGVMQLLAQDASIDGLTGLYNRRQFNRFLEQEWRRSCRNKLNLALVMIDIDFFKRFNDFYGHCQGDECLQQVAGILSEQLGRGDDVVARFGGEEFVLILPNTDQQGLKNVMNKVISSIRLAQIPHANSEVGHCLTVSLGGVAAEPHADNTPLRMLELADQALYQAKFEGRDQWRCSQYPAPDYA